MPIVAPANSASPRRRERIALVTEHHVVGAGHADDERDAGGRQQREERVHVILVGFRMIGVTDVAANRQPEQLAAEMIFEAARMICLPS